MKQARNLLNRIVETPLVFPFSATGGEPKNSWIDPGVHYWIDADGVFTRTKKAKIVFRRPIFYGLHHISKTSGRTIIENIISKEEYLALPKNEQKNILRLLVVLLVIVVHL